MKQIILAIFTLAFNVSIASHVRAESPMMMLRECDGILLEEAKKYRMIAFEQIKLYTEFAKKDLKMVQALDQIPDQLNSPIQRLRLAVLQANGHFKENYNDILKLEIAITDLRSSYILFRLESIIASKNQLTLPTTGAQVTALGQISNLRNRAFVSYTTKANNCNSTRM